MVWIDAWRVVAMVAYAQSLIIASAFWNRPNVKLVAESMRSFHASLMANLAVA